MATLGKTALNWQQDQEKCLVLKNDILEAKGVPAQIIRKFALDCELSTELLNFLGRFLKITGGFRTSHPEFRIRVINHILEGLKKNDERSEKALWELYKGAASTYINKNLKNLSKLLMSEQADQQIELTLFFKKIIELTPLYDVSKQDITTFYEIWFFKESQEVKNLLHSDYIENLSQISTIVSKKIEKHILDVEKKINQLKSSVLEIERDLTTHLEKLTEENAEDRESLADLKLEIENRFSHIPSLIGQKVEGISKALKQVREDRPQKLTIDPRELNKISKRIENLETEISKIRPQQGAGLPNSELTTSSLRKKVKVVTETEFLSLFFKQLRNSKGFDWVEEEDVIVHHIFSTLPNSIVLKDGSIYDQWSRIYHQSYPPTIVAEPTWVKTDHLEEHLKRHTAEKVFIIENFDSAIYEAYLLPFLLKERREKKISLVLVSNDYSQSLPSSEVLRYAPIFSLQQQELMKKRDYKSSVKLDLDIPFDTNTFYSIDSLHSRSLSDFRLPIQIASRNLIIEIPPETLDFCEQAACRLAGYFNDVHAISVAIEICLLPYVETKYSRDRASSFVNILSEYLDKWIELP